MTIATAPPQYAELISALNKDGCTPYSLVRSSPPRPLRTPRVMMPRSPRGSPAKSNEPDAAAPSLTRSCELSRPLKRQQPPPEARGLYLPLGSRTAGCATAPGYINMLDAFLAFQLVRELRKALTRRRRRRSVGESGGRGLGVTLNALSARPDIADPSSLAPLARGPRARAPGRPPLCSFGDFAALLHVVDENTALVLKKEVSDGIIAPGFEPKALEILSAKKGGKFVCVEVDPDYVPPALEYREVYGVASRRREMTEITLHDVARDEVAKGPMPPDAQRDLVCSHYGQIHSIDSICFARGGQAVGVGAGQQSRSIA